MNLSKYIFIRWNELTLCSLILQLQFHLQYLQMIYLCRVQVKENYPVPK